VLDLFNKIDSRQLKGLIVWVPMIPGDSALDAAELVSPEKRLTMQAWDSRRSVGEAFAKTLGLNCPAWDVYLVYEPGVRWNGDTAPMPSLWMHQLSKKSGADPALHLQPDRLTLEVRNALARSRLP
jgi:hypothetical protein